MILGIDNRQHNIHYSFNCGQLENRHILFTGISGCGKTHAIEYLLTQAVNDGVSAVIIDYCNGFTEDKLEPVFKEKLINKIHRRAIYTEGAGFNPFTIHSIRGAYDIIQEKPSDTADRVADTIDKVFRLGIQQKACLYKHAENCLNLARYMDFNILRDILSESPDPVERNTLSKLKSMIDKNIFTGSPIKWRDVIYGDPTITIIDISGFSSDMQKIIVEFLVWDLWYYSSLYGSKNNPFIAVFDECQLLNHRLNSPTSKILTEGRKFGWSGWYATQFLRGAFEPDELKRLQQAGLKLVFKPPVDEIKTQSKVFDCDNPAPYSDLLRKLDRGTCLANGNLSLPNGKTYNNSTVKVWIPSISDL